MSRVVLGSVLCGGILIGVVGCGSSGDPDRPKTAPTSVIVTYNGQPASGATVTFHPASSQQQGAVAITDAQGRAEMWTFDPGDGVIPGAYKVTVSKVTAGSLPDPDTTSPEEYKRLEEQLASQPPKHELPEKYSNAATSGLTADVAESGDNNITFDLKD